MKVQPQIIDVESIEMKIRAHVFNFRIRLKETFNQYDKIHHGVVSHSQFRRCLKTIMDNGTGRNLTDQEFSVLLKKYDNGYGQAKWWLFSENIEQMFGLKKLEKTPTKKTPSPFELFAPHVPLNSGIIDKDVGPIINILKSDIKLHGSGVKVWFEDFDNYHVGLISKSQFRRGIPANLITEAQIHLLANYYTDSLTGLVNYFNLNNDVKREITVVIPATRQLVALRPEEGNSVNTGSLSDIHVNLILNIRQHVHKHRVDLISAFKDFDKLNHGQVTGAQFASGLYRSGLYLKEKDIRMIKQKYDADGKILYKLFCADIDSVFDDEAAATIECQRRVNSLSPRETLLFESIMAKLKQILKHRQVELTPYFQDFDKKLGNIGVVTKPQFERILSNMSISLTEEEFKLIFKRYEDEPDGRIPYREFIKAVEPKSKVYTAISK